jgi:hypothetical protein
MFKSLMFWKYADRILHKTPQRVMLTAQLRRAKATVWLWYLLSEPCCDQSKLFHQFYQRAFVSRNSNQSPPFPIIFKMMAKRLNLFIPVFTNSHQGCEHHSPALLGNSLDSSSLKIGAVYLICPYEAEMLVSNRAWRCWLHFQMSVSNQIRL